MCWLLIRARSNPKPTAYKAGDIVEVRPDNCNWGRREGLPSFYRIQIIDLPYNVRLANLCQRLDDESTGLFDPTGMLIMRLIRIRRHLIDIESIPNLIKHRLKVDGVISVTKLQIRNFFKNNQGEVVSIDG